jgi:hypothetical protein
MCRYWDMPKRTRKKESQDINQFAASIVARATADPPPVNLNDPAIRSQIMRAMGSRGGVKGAATLNARLSPAQRKASAKRAAQARWGNKK